MTKTGQCNIFNRCWACSLFSPSPGSSAKTAVPWPGGRRPSASGHVRHSGHPAQGTGRHARLRGDQRRGRGDRAPRPAPAPPLSSAISAAVRFPTSSKSPGAEFVLALQALPIVLVMSVLTTLLFHWRILPPIVRGFSWLLERTLGIGGAVGLSTAANIFLGMVEAPLFIRPYLARLTRSELFIVMTGGMAGIAGTVLVLYATLLGPVIPDAAGAFRDRLGDGRTGGNPRQPDHGAGARATSAPAAQRFLTWKRSRPARWTRSSGAPRRVSSSCSTSAPC